MKRTVLKRTLPLLLLTWLVVLPLSAQHRNGQNPPNRPQHTDRPTPYYYNRPEKPFNNKQRFRDKYRKLMEKKWNFIRQRLMLTPREARALKPVIDSYDKAMMQLVFRKQKLIHFIRKTDTITLSDTQAAQKMKEFLEIEKEMHRIKMNYYKQIQKILPPRKAFKLIALEDVWRRRLMKRRRQNAPYPNKPGRPHILHEK